MSFSTLLWGLGGLVTRRLETHDGLQIVFWRSAFAALAVLGWFVWQRSQRPFAPLATRAVWVSGSMWAVMFSCYALALSLTRVANVLIVQSLGPIFTALLAWAVFRRAPGGRTWVAIAVAAAGIATMYAFDIAGLDARSLAGVALALGIPCAAAVNWVQLQRSGRNVDLSAAVFVGSVLSMLAVLPAAWPLRVSGHDLAWLAFMGVVQLALPCLLCMRAARELAAPEAALLSLLETVFGILLTWAFAGERPGAATFAGGAAVLAALAYKEWPAPLRARPRAA